MATDVDLDGPRFGPPPGEARALVVLLHGLGADGNDLISLAPLFAQFVPDAAFHAPHAPFPCDTVPFGRQWFSFRSQKPEDVLKGVETAAPILDKFLDAQLKAYGLADDRLALVAFSQGAMMALHVALRRAKPCAAVVGYSGMLIAPERLADEIRSRPPVLLVHGDADEVVDFRALGAAEAALQANQVRVHAEARPGLGHGIDEDGIGLGAVALKELLGGETSDADA